MNIKRRSYVWLMLAALLLALAALLPTAASAETGERDDVHPAVDVFAELFPGEKIPVIVQSDDPALAEWVEEHGGTVVREFNLVGAFQAEMPAEAVRTLDFSDRADWISLDAPLMTSGRGGDEVDAAGLETVYPFAANSVPAWEEGVSGDDVTVAVIDSGINRRGRLPRRRHPSRRPHLRHRGRLRRHHLGPTVPGRPVSQGGGRGDRRRERDAVRPGGGRGAPAGARP